MKTSPKTMPPFIIYGIFVLGLLCTLAFRSLTIIGVLSPGLLRPVWYFGVVGYIVFFAYRFKITVKRKKAIRDYALIDAVKNNNCFSEKQKEVLLYLLLSIEKSKENINYLAIFFFSVCAIIVDFMINYFFRK